jgi:hypothetical protein
MKLLESVYEYLSDRLSKQESDGFLVDDTSKEILKALKGLVSKHEIFKCIVKLEKDIRNNQITNESIACEFVNKRLKKIKDKCTLDQCKIAYGELKKMMEERNIPQTESSNGLIGEIEKAVDENIKEKDDSAEFYKCYETIVKHLKSGKDDNEVENIELDEEYVNEIKERFENLTNNNLTNIFESYVRKDYEQMSIQYKETLNETTELLTKVLIEKDINKDDRKALNDSLKMLSKRKFNKNTFIDDIENLLSIKQEIEESYVNN